MTPSVPVSVLRSQSLEDPVDFILKILKEHVGLVPEVRNSVYECEVA